MANSSVHVVRASQHENARFLILRAPLQDVATLLPGLGGKTVESFKSGLDGLFCLFQVKIEHVFERAMHLLQDHVAIAETYKRRCIDNPVFRKDVALFNESGFATLGTSHH